MVAGPNQLATYPTRPSRASSSGAVDMAHKDAAWELIPNGESLQALPQGCVRSPFAVDAAPPR